MLENMELELSPETEKILLSMAKKANISVDKVLEYMVMLCQNKFSQAEIIQGLSQKKTYDLYTISLNLFMAMLKVDEKELLRRMVKIFSTKYVMQEALDLLKEK